MAVRCQKGADLTVDICDGVALYVEFQAYSAK